MVVVCGYLWLDICMTKKQINTALKIIKELHAAGVPDLVTAREAADICDKYKVNNTKFHRCPIDRKHSRPVNLADLAATIVKKGGK